MPLKKFVRWDFKLARDSFACDLFPSGNRKNPTNPRGLLFGGVMKFCSLGLGPVNPALLGNKKKLINSRLRRRRFKKKQKKKPHPTFLFNSSSKEATNGRNNSSHPPPADAETSMASCSRGMKNDFENQPKI